MKKHIKKQTDSTFLFCTGLAATVVLSGCISKNVEMTENQQRMQRCDQYIDMAREQCLRGENVTIDDYQEEYRAFEKDVRDKQKAEEELQRIKAEKEEKEKEQKLKEALKDVNKNAEEAREKKIEQQIQQIEDGS
uniref:hypothetical protein n=1 Tax=Ningiella ruwaisensis TaxID=2364274 RepID=UPI00109F1274|nr:hypothetical protein [Ningiella ruwaisensis]